MNSAPEYSHIVQVSELGNRPLEINLAANAEQCAALAKRLSLSSIKSFKAQVFLTLLKNSDVDLKASFSVQVIQPCTVTLAPVSSDLKAKFSMTYTPVVEEDEESEEDEVFEDLDDMVEPPEPLIDQKIDIGAALVEHLALEIDPFPRVKGAVFEGYVAGSKSEKESGFEKKNPFAALSQLQTKPKTKKNKD